MPGLVPALIAVLSLVPCLTPPAAAAAGDGLESLARSYRELAAYRDQGTVEITGFEDGTQTTERFRFTTLAAPPDGFRLEIRPEAGSGSAQIPQRVFWLEDGGLWCYDGTSRAYTPVPDLSRTGSSRSGSAAEEVWNAVTTALLVPRLLAGEEAPAAAGPGVTVETETDQPCGDGSGESCRRLAVTTETDRLRLWVGEEGASGAGLVRRVELERELGTALPETLDDAEEGFLGVSTAYLWVRVQHTVREVVRAPDSESETGREIRAAARFTPPPEARRVEALPPVPSASVASTVPDAEPVEVFTDEITVALFPVALRVLDRHGHPVANLEPGDFRATVRGRREKTEVPIVAVDWEQPAVPWTEELEELERQLTPEQWRELGLVRPDPGQLVVIFVQSDFNAVRIKGHLSFLPQVASMLHSLPVEDRVAVVAFGSHLELWQDFTRDREVVYRAVEQAVRFGAVPQATGPADPEGPRLARHFDLRRAKRAGLVERGLGVLADALEALGKDDTEAAREEKTVIFLGWGVGRHDGFGYTVNPQWLFPAIQTFYRARAAVHVLDVTPYEVERGGKSGVGPAHTLERGLRMLADKTGGTFARTYHFPVQAWKGLVQTVSGYYVLQIDANAVPPGGGLLTVELREPKGRILVTRPLLLTEAPPADSPPSRSPKAPPESPTAGEGGEVP